MQNNRNLGHGMIEKFLLYDDHRSSNKDIAISTTTIIGSNWKAQRAMKKDVILKHEVNPMMRRSSALGSGAHQRFEDALKNDAMTNATETYNELEVDGVWISGSLDIVYNGHIADLKTSYGTKFPAEKQTKAIEQMSIYRVLNPDIYIKDQAYVLFVSMSNNAYVSYPITLMDETSTMEMMRSLVHKAKNIDRIDCNDDVPFNMCNYCSWDEQDCKKLELSLAGDFS